MKPTIETMKLAVASMLIDCLGTEDGELNTLYWLDTKARVTDREWLHICFLAEEKFFHPYSYHFIQWERHLSEIVLPYIATEFDCIGQRGGQVAMVSHASDKQRLEAICRIITPSIFTNENITNLPGSLP